MSFLRHREIFPSDGSAAFAASPPAHRLDEFPAGYSLAGCATALPAAASPTASEYALKSSCRSIVFHRTAHSVLTVCLTPGGRPKVASRLNSLMSLATYGSSLASTIGICEAKTVEPD